MNFLKTPVALIATLTMLFALPSVATAASQVSRESVQTFEQQLKSGEITAAKFNHADRRMFVTLKNGKVYFVHYQAHGAPQLESELHKTKGITVTVLARDEAQQEAEQVKNERTSSTKTFVIIGLIVVVVLAIGVYFATRRRGERE